MTTLISARTDMNKPAEPATEAKPPEPEVKAPENETDLANIAMPLSETVLKMQGKNNVLMYGILQRNRAVTPQSDFMRLQFRGYAINSNNTWGGFPEEETGFHASRNCAWVRIDHPSKSIAFGPRAGIIITDTVQGSGLDDFLFAAVVAWVKITYPSYSVSPGMVTIQNSSTEADKLHRQAFYAKQGFDFEWNDNSQRSGLYFKDKASRLIGVCENEQIAEFGGEAMLQTLIKQDQDRQELEQRMAKTQAMNNAVHQALDKEKHTAQALMVALVIVLIIGMWAVL
jgi:hypothetical protein